MSTTTDTFARFVDVLADSLDDHEAAGDTLASRVHLPWFHFDRLVSAAAGEPPATFRRRFLLERASPTTRSMRAPSSPSTGSTSTRPCARCSHASSGSSRCGTPSLTTERTTSTSNGTRARLDETFVNALCDPPEVFTYGGMIAHVLTFAAHRRTLVCGALSSAGVPDLVNGDPMRWVAEHA